MKGRQLHETLRPAVAALAAAPAGGFVRLDGEEHYRISGYRSMAPFLVSLASDTDLWMFVTSGGGLTAGRVDADGALFPYLTVDQLHDAHHHTGPLTLMRVAQKGTASVLWEPFSPVVATNPAIEHNIYKNVSGSRLVCEEIHHDLQLAFRYSWSGCDEFGWVRSMSLDNRGADPVQVSVLDGLRNVLPYGAPLALYQQASNLVDAYKKAEVDPETGLGIFSLTAGITDRAEALEVLRANTVWCCGLEDFRVHLSPQIVTAFRCGRILAPETTLNGARGNYLVSCVLALEPGEAKQWYCVADVGRDHLQLARLRRDLRVDKDLNTRITEHLRRAGDNLRRYVAKADGLQLTARPLATAHHFANVLFNNMRGGVFWHNDDVPVTDFVDFLHTRNRAVARRQQAVIAELPDKVTGQELWSTARRTDDADFERLCLEYLPLHFGRRHGDPSRPWNRFSIRVRNHTGAPVLYYEGNWRDVFQNWEALCSSFPGFLPSIVAKFVNASTVDGYNPYRITRDGVDWETASPDDPWSNIGYWGDHQIVYLHRLLESMTRHDPAAIARLLGREIFSYAEVPYVIKPYAEILRNPKATIDFDAARAARIDDRVAQLGTDGKLVTDRAGSIYRANLLEKLLVPILAKLSNLIPDAGIWMNTQRPEWNDANNALGGGGVSVVTLCYLRRYLVYLVGVFDGLEPLNLAVSTEVVSWLREIETVLQNEQQILAHDRCGARDRKRLQDLLGEAFSAYRAAVYVHGFTGKTELSVARVADFLRVALRYLESGIRANRRDDGLYHAYNLLEHADATDAVGIVRLPEMLEGQVAALSSQVPTPEEALSILEQLFASNLYRPDQHSFMLYPARELPGFFAKNTVPEADALAIPLLSALLDVGDRSLVARDADGTYRFRGSFTNARDVAAALDDLALDEAWTALVSRDRTAVLALFETVFRHKSYTGRSGVMYAYEGLGCIYWHMVAKLLLAVQEIVLGARRERQPRALQAELAKMYFRIRAGLGYEKSVGEFGAFPTDPYSHTPPSGGAKQPGMTGQVKEEILTRRGELGVCVEAGTVRFDPFLLRGEEFLEQAAEFRYVDVNGQNRSLALAPGSLAFTIYQVPVVYERTSDEPWLEVTLTDGSTSRQQESRLEPELAAGLFLRDGRIDRIHVGVAESGLCRL